jgi:hypothetical protein
MEAIWQNQHPPDCSTAKFLAIGGWEEGFGSEIHVMGSGLAVAMQMGRVFVLLKEDSKTATDWQVKTDFCRTQGDFSYKESMKNEYHLLLLYSRGVGVYSVYSVCIVYVVYM